VRVKLKIENSLKISIAILLALLATIGLDAIGLGIPFLRQVIGFIFLTFIPGFLLLRTLKFHELSTLEVLLYSAGLSISFLMFIGLSMSALHPIVSESISTIPLATAISIAVLVLCIFSYERGKGFANSNHVGFKDVFSPSALFLCSIPILSILGTWSVVFYGNNLILLLMIVVISFTVALVGFDRFISKKLYPLAIVAIAVALFYSSVLVSRYLPGWDINLEYHFSHLVITRSFWDPAIPNNINAMASIVMLSPIYSILLGVNDAWVLRIIYPLLFSLVPLGLYRVYQKLTDEKVAFLAVFFFMSFFTFFTEMTALGRQEIAELFLVLLLLLIVDKEVGSTKVALSVIFAISLIISHYSLSYIFIFFYLTPTWISLLLSRNSTLNRLWKGILDRKKDNTRQRENLIPTTGITSGIISGAFVLFFIVFAFLWYIYVSSSAPFESFASIGNNIVTSIFTEFFNPGGRGYLLSVALGGTLSTPSLQREIYRIVQYVTEFFMIVGILGIIARWKGFKINREYSVMALTSMVLLLVCVALPYFAGYLDIERLYQITLIFLSPLCVLGGIALFRGALKLFRASRITIRAVYAMLLIVLVAYFMFNTGFIFEVTRDAPFSASLGFQRMKASTNPVTEVSFNGFYTFDVEVFSAKWLSGYKSNASKICADIQAASRVLVSYGMISPDDLEAISNNATVNSISVFALDFPAYIYLKRLNVVDGLITYRASVGGTSYFNATEILPILDKCNCVYSNGGSTICELPPKHP
jgi:uncharacterized membrane protein